MRWKVVLLLILAGGLVAGGWAYYNRSAAVYDRITRQQGYSVSLIKENISTEFFLRPEWIPKKNGDETQLDLVLDDKFGTQIVLEKVGKRERDFYIQLNAMPHPNRKSGQYLTTTLIHPDGSYSTSGGLDRWVITNPAGEDILKRNYGMGDGPGNQSFIFIDDSYLEKFEQGANVRFSGYNLYGYRQLDSGRETYWFWIMPLLLLLALVFLYRRRDDPEERLGWKLIGYFILGGFTFSINAVKLPLGFAVYLLFYRKPKPNGTIKIKAALLGLLVYVLQLFEPAFAGMIHGNSGETTISNVLVKQIGVDGVWNTVTAQAPVSKQAKLLTYNTVLSTGGELQELEFTTVERDKNRYTHTHAVYNAQKHTLDLKRTSTDQWLQYNRQIAAEHFFEQVVHFHLMNLRPAVEYPYVRLELMEDGIPVNYGMKEGHKFAVDPQGVHVIANEQLPVQGYWISACGIRENVKPYSSCEDRADYLFDLEGTVKE